ncbi:MAG: protease SohB [Gammaproteobacteria bacterium]|nr:protease SohB [Gammaproteobacteria bacterium]
MAIKRPRAFVIDFKGDIQASAVSSLREEITAVLAVAEDDDEVLIRLESSGGVVHGYGLAASQLQRVRNSNIALTVSIDKVAASGGYMMACIADTIISAPFALIGSIGVVAQIPNFHRLLKKNEVDVELITAGEFKRTLTFFGENTDKGREKFAEELEDIHLLFKEFVTENRPSVSIEEVSTGEAWFGVRALERQLVDQLKTSDEYILDLCEERDVFQVQYIVNKNKLERLFDRLTKLGRTRLEEEFNEISNFVR